MSDPLVQVCQTCGVTSLRDASQFFSLLKWRWGGQQVTHPARKFDTPALVIQSWADLEKWKVKSFIPHLCHITREIEKQRVKEGLSTTINYAFPLLPVKKFGNDSGSQTRTTQMSCEYNKIAQLYCSKITQLCLF